jgi:hypothetical protein
LIHGCPSHLRHDHELRQLWSVLRTGRTTGVGGIRASSAPASATDDGRMAHLRLARICRPLTSAYQTSADHARTRHDPRYALSVRWRAAEHSTLQWLSLTLLQITSMLQGTKFSSRIHTFVLTELCTKLKVDTHQCFPEG